MLSFYILLLFFLIAFTLSTYQSFILYIYFFSLTELPYTVVIYY